MDNNKDFTPLCNADGIAKFKTHLETIIEAFRNEVGARNVEIIASVKDAEKKCDLTIRY